MSDEVTFSALGDTRAGNGDKRGVLNGPNKFRASFMLALVGVVLVFAGMSNALIEVLAIACGIAALVARKVKSIPREQQMAPRATTIMAICSIVLGVAVCFSVANGTGKLNVEVNADNWQGGSIEVNMTGTDSSGKAVDETLRVTPGKSKTIPSAKAGTYSFKVDESALTVNDIVYKVDQSSERYDFNKKSDMTVAINLVVDEEATSALAEKKAAEEAAAAEQKAAEERAAAEQKAAEEAAAAEAAAQKKAEQEEERLNRTVYITGSGSKYHSSGCRTIKKSSVTAITIRDAEASGYEPCGVCNPR